MVMVVRMDCVSVSTRYWLGLHDDQQYPPVYSIIFCLFAQPPLLGTKFKSGPGTVCLVQLLNLSERASSV